jgi:hypothetical protein
MPRGTAAAAVWCAALGSLVLAGPVAGQAWVPGKGRITTALSYQYLQSDKHLFSVEDPATGSNELDLGDIQSQLASMSIDWGVTNRLAISGGIAAASAKYDGIYPEDAVLDDGSWHSDFQDLFLNVRYNMLTAPLVVTPSISVAVPTNNYGAIGHAAVGSHLTNLSLGMNVGWAPRRLPGSYVHANYTFTFVEDPVNAPPLSRSNINGTLGYFILPTLSAGAFISYAHVHGGLDWYHDLNEHNFHAHDQGAAARATSLGGGLTYSITRAYALGISYSAVVDGANTHNPRGFMVSNTFTYNGF